GLGRGSSDCVFFRLRTQLCSGNVPTIARLTNRAHLMDVEAEIRDLKRRVGELEGGFGFLTQQVQAVHRDLLGFQERAHSRLHKIDAGWGGVEVEVGELKGGVGARKSEIGGLRSELPSVVGDVMREVLREQRG